MSSLLKDMERKVLPFVQRPVRYIGSEIGIRRKDPGSVRLRMALVYPDVYEVGMSNLGLKVLYQVADSFAEVAVERAFTPWPDAEKLMREHGIPLYGLESYTPLREFDLIGITLQSELTYTNVLTVLDLAGIPLLAAERHEGDPLVSGGGPCAVNPEVMAPFFDFFVLGDGEDALGEITARLLEDFDAGFTREACLESLRNIDGVYIPGPGNQAEPTGVKVLWTRDLNSRPAPDGLPVPLTQLAQHHHAVEIMRGCTCGCRFCQAGMHYRPVRVRTVEKVIQAVRKGVDSGGWDTVTLLSLSSADYPAVEELVELLLPELGSRGVVLSFPSLRVDSSTLRLVERIERAGKSGLTFAVEAGTDRLRRVIGKKVEEEELISLAGQAFRAGWPLIKIYFMVGLPTETVEDVDEIARLVRRVADLGRRIPGRHNINVAVSPFVPKPGTPFQWEAQATPQEIREKVARLRRQVQERSVSLKVHDPEASAIEGILARGDRSLSAVLKDAWEHGARFDGWSECFDPELWREAFARKKLDPESFLAQRSKDSPLPWHFVHTPVSEHFLKDQAEKALRAENAEDCKDGACLNCGAEKQDVCKKLRAAHLPGKKERKSIAAAKISPLPLVTQVTDRRLWRVRYARRDLLRFCGHLDMIRSIEFSLRRGAVPVIYSGGFTTRMRLHFSPPLPLGLESSAEYFDLETLPCSDQELKRGLEEAFRGFPYFTVLALKALPQGLFPQLAGDIVACLYQAELSTEAAQSLGNWGEFLNKRREIILREGAVLNYTDKKGRERKVSLARALESVKEEIDFPSALTFVLDLQGNDALRPDIFLGYLLGLEKKELALCRIEKKEAFVCRGDRLVSPLDF